MRLSELKAKGQRESAIVWGGAEVAFCYNPGNLTPEVLDDWQKLAEETGVTTSAAIGRIMPQFVVWWDVLDENDQRLPVTPEVAATFPVSFLEAILDKAMEEGKAGKASESPSSSFS